MGPQQGATPRGTTTGSFPILSGTWSIPPPSGHGGFPSCGRKGASFNQSDYALFFPMEHKRSFFIVNSNGKLLHTEQQWGASPDWVTTESHGKLPQTVWPWGASLD